MVLQGSPSLWELEPNFDSHKRGAFLEKTQRFQELESTNTPAFHMNRSKPTQAPTHKPSASSVDRYAILQRKVEELERVHLEGKKTVSTI